MKEDGFTLIEILIAFVIFAGFMAVILPLFSKTATQDNNRLRQHIAARHATSILEIAEPVDPLKPEIRTGSLPGGFNWELTFLPYGEEEGRKAWIIAPYQIRIEMRWDKYSLEMSTLKLAPKEIL